MTKVQIKLPDELVRSAKAEGLLKSDAVEAMFRDAIRRKSGSRLVTIVQRIQTAKIPTMKMDEIQAEVDAVRTKRLRRRERRS